MLKSSFSWYDMAGNKKLTGSFLMKIMGLSQENVTTAWKITDIDDYFSGNHPIIYPP